MDYKTDVVTFPGRVRAWQGNSAQGYDDLLPYSCKLRKYKNNLIEELIHTSKDLRWGAGVKLVLDDYKPEKPLAKDVKWYFYLPEDHPDFDKITPHQRQFLAPQTLLDQTSDGYIFVDDTMDDVEALSDLEVYLTIEESWEAFWVSLSFAAKLDSVVIVDLSKLRPHGAVNGRGLTATGPVGDGSEMSNTASFLPIYEYIYKYAVNPCIENFLCLFGVLNNTIRRGGLYKNGIITSSMWYENPNFEDYLNFPLVDIPGSHKRGVRLDEKILENKALSALVREKIRDESLFVENVSLNDTAYPNVCVAGESWIDTSEGTKQVRDLVGRPFTAFIGDEKYLSTNKGFWSNGIKPVLCITTDAPSHLICTYDHKILGKDGNLQYWIEAQDLHVGECLVTPNTLSGTMLVTNIKPVQDREVFDCSILQAKRFVANEFIVSNCEGLFVPDNGTCLIGRINLGQCVELSDIVEGYRQLATELTTLHLTWRDKHPEKAVWSAPLEEDRQIGLDVMGLANLLRIHGVTYKEFIDSLDWYLTYEADNDGLCDWIDEDEVSPSAAIVCAIMRGMYAAKFASDIVCFQHKQPELERIFTVEPAQSHSYETVDADGFTTCRGIWPPLAKRVVRDSESQKGKIYKHGNVETINDLTEDEYERLNELFYQLMKLTGRAHSISYDLRREPTQEWFERFVTEKALPTKYYTEIDSTRQRDYLQKKAQLATTEAALPSLQAQLEIEAQEVCSIANPGSCSLCEE